MYQCENTFLFFHHLIQMNVDSIDTPEDKILTAVTEEKKTLVIAFNELNLNESLQSNDKT